MKLNKVDPISRQDAEKIFLSGNSEEICDAIIRVTFHDQDWKWVQSACISLLNIKNIDVNKIAFVCLGHLVRIHGNIDLNIVLPILEKFSKNDEFSGYVNDVYDDIDIFLKK